MKKLSVKLVSSGVVEKKPTILGIAGKYRSIESGTKALRKARKAINPLAPRGNTPGRNASFSSCIIDSVRH